MKEKMNQQVERMKAQTFGVEVEMNHITRANAAKVAAEYFGTTRYEDSARRNGYHAWSAWDAQGREWKFVYDSSIRGADDQKCEMVTPILRYEDMEMLQELCRKLRKAGAKSDYTRGCGVHIHIGAQGHTAQSLRNLANIMASHEMLLVNALKINAGRLLTYCKPVNTDFIKAINDKKPTKMADLADIWYETHHTSWNRNAHYNQSRYHMLNLHATFTKGTVEFRLFQFNAPDGNHRSGIHAGALKAYIQLCLAMSQMAKEVKSASAKPQQTDNPKYAMRTWLLRMGFIGDEFATARDLLTRNLDGDAAFRNGRAA